LSAWDFGRCGIIGRYSAHAGYVSEDEAWGYMLTASENAAKAYNNWREFLAAYFLGRSVAYGADDIGNYSDIINYLLNNSYSPYNLVPFK
jgi:hypothetical protein